MKKNSSPDLTAKIDALVPWGLTAEEYAQLGLRCLDQAGLRLSETQRIERDLYDAGIITE